MGVSARGRSLLAAWTLLVGCGRDPRPRPAVTTSAGVPLLTVDTATVEVPLALPAQLYVEHDALVYARAPGIVESVYVDLGARVGEGQLLAQLESVDQEIALAEADQAYAVAERDIARQRELAQIRAISSADSEAAEFAFQHAALNRRQARRNFALTRVIAPFPGVVTARLARPRRLVATGDSLFRVSALGPLRVSVRVPEGAVGRLRTGGAAQILGQGGTSTHGTVIRASPAIDAASGTREFIVQLAPGSGLLPGAAVTVRVGAESRRVVAVPPEAIAEQGYVLVWDHGRAVLRAVTVGGTLPDGRLEVTSGLVAGEQVVRSAQ
jgi:RND family efflux transporter MFP subunit